MRALALDLTPTATLTSSSDSPDELSPRGEEIKTPEPRKRGPTATSAFWKVKDFAISTLRSAGDIAQLIGRQVYLQVFERAKNAELDKLMSEELRKATTKKNKKKKKPKKKEESKIEFQPQPQPKPELAKPKAVPPQAAQQQLLPPMLPL